MEIEQWLKTPIEQIEPENLRLAIQRLTIDKFPNRTAFKSAKESLEQKYAEVIRHRGNIQTKNNENNEKLALPKIQQLFMENLASIRAESAYGAIPISKDLNIKIKYFPCGHEKTFKIYELLNIERNNFYYQVLLTKWEIFFREGGVIGGRFNCEECKKQKETLRTKFSRYDDKPIGNTTLKLRLLR